MMWLDFCVCSSRIYIIESLPFLGALFSGIKDIHTGGQPSPSSFSRPLHFPNCNSNPLNTNSPTPPLLLAPSIVLSVSMNLPYSKSLM